MIEHVPIIELLQKAHAFPCPYQFKVIGKADQSFVARVVALARLELLSEVDPPYRVRAAVGGRHLAITLEPIMQSAQHVVAMYRRLARLEGLVMLL